jgi:hypothetical protein
MYLDAAYYRERADQCREAAALAVDEDSRMHWHAVERRWLMLANQAEIVAGLLDSSPANDNTHHDSPRDPGRA